MKKVFTKSSDVIHLFAQQDQEEANCSNVFFNKTKLYSYGHHYLLAEFMNVDINMPHDHEGVYLYDKSWDHLMPVISEIFDLPINHGIYRMKYIKEELSTTEIKPTYKEVVSFIKWYNENK